MLSFQLKPPSFKDWMQENFEPHELSDILRHGVQNGFHGLIYYHETSELYEKYHEDIWNMINDDAESMDVLPLALISSFNGCANVCDDRTLKNLLVWYAAEKAAYELTEM